MFLLFYFKLWVDLERLLKIYLANDRMLMYSLYPAHVIPTFKRQMQVDVSVQGQPGLGQMGLHRETVSQTKYTYNIYHIHNICTYYI